MPCPTCEADGLSDQARTSLSPSQATEQQQLQLANVVPHRNKPQGQPAAPTFSSNELRQRSSRVSDPEAAAQVELLTIEPEEPTNCRELVAEQGF